MLKQIEADGVSTKKGKEIEKRKSKDKASE